MRVDEVGMWWGEEGGGWVVVGARGGVGCLCGWRGVGRVGGGGGEGGGKGGGKGDGGGVVRGVHKECPWGIRGGWR